MLTLFIVLFVIYVSSFHGVESFTISSNIVNTRSITMKVSNDAFARQNRATRSGTSLL